MDGMGDDHALFTSRQFIIETVPQLEFRGLQRELREGERNGGSCLLFQTGRDEASGG